MASVRLSGVVGTDPPRAVHFLWSCLLAIVVTVVLVACNGSGGGSSKTGNLAVIRGIASKGPVAGGTVTAYAVTASGAKGPALGSTTTDANGNYSLSLNYIGPIFLELTGGIYTDEATGSKFSVPTGIGAGLQAALPNVTADGTFTAEITPLTTFAAALAQAMSGGLSNANITSANQQVSSYFSTTGATIDILNTQPINPLIANSAIGQPQSAINYGLILAGISQEAQTMATSDPLALVHVLASDFSDAEFNGYAGAAELLNSGGSFMSPNTGTTNLGTAILTFSSNSLLNLSGGSVLSGLVTKIDNPSNNYTVGGTVSGLSGTLVLSNTTNDDSLNLTGDGNFAFPTGIVSGGAYDVTVQIQPAGQICSAVDGSGNVGSTNITNIMIDCVSPSSVGTGGESGSVVTFVGSPGVGNFLVLEPGATTDSAGDVYVADFGNNLIRKITPGGVVTTLSGMAGVSGSAGGAGTVASFNGPDGVATDGVGNLYVADNGNSIIRKIALDGVVTTLAGMAGVVGNTDGTGAAASFNHPTGVATDGAGNVYVADWGNNVIRKISPGGVVTTFAGTAGVIGGSDGTGAAASFNSPAGIATDSVGNLYVADAANETIRKITPSRVVTTLAGAVGVIGSVDGIGAEASFDDPAGIAIDSGGNLYVADATNETIRKITPGGVVTTLAGTAGVAGSADGTGTAASFNRPVGIAIDSEGNVYVVDGANDTTRKITIGSVVSTLAGTAGVVGRADGIGAVASFNFGFSPL